MSVHDVQNVYVATCGQQAEDGTVFHVATEQVRVLLYQLEPG